MDKFQPKDPSKDGHKKDHNSDQNKSHGLQPRQMSRRMGRSMNRFGSGETSKNPLDKRVQTKMENAFQEDFSDVEVTKDSSESTQMGAQAFAQGKKIHFAPGNYKPHTTEGQELIGHELAHVVQQKKARAIGTKQAKGSAINEDSALEKEADEMGKKAAESEEGLINVSAHSAGSIAGMAPTQIELPDTANARISRQAEVAAKDSDNPMFDLIATLMKGFSNYLGPVKGSKLGAKVSVDIPAATGIKVNLGMEAEQERKNNASQIENSLKGTAGISVGIENIGQGNVEFGLMLGAESNNFNTSAQLLSYGFYKSGRAAADLLNDFGGVATGGLPGSVALYYGLNYLYSSSNDSLLDKTKDDKGAESNIADLEKELFGIKGYGDYEQSNKNEVSFGASTGVGLDVADGAFKAEAEASSATKINQDSLRETGIIGKQKNIGFFEDYKIGGFNELALKFSSAFSAGGFSGNKTLVAKYLQSGKNEGGKTPWQYQGLDFTMSYAMKGLAGMSLTSKEIIQQIIQAGVGLYNSERMQVKEKDIDARPKELNSADAIEAIHQKVQGFLTQTGAAATLDAIKAGTTGKGPLEISDKIEVKLKVSGKRNDAPKLTFIIGRVTKKAIDLGVVEASLIDFSPLISFEFQHQ